MVSRTKVPVPTKIEEVDEGVYLYGITEQAISVERLLVIGNQHLKRNPV